jgi:hypothetical protein
VTDHDGEVIQLHGHSAYQPDMGALARNHLARAREQLGYTPEELADALGPLLPNYPINAGLIENWERTAVPPGDVLVAVGVLSRTAPLDAGGETANDMLSQVFGQRYADVTAVFATRSELHEQLPLSELFAEAKRIDASGLSLNVFCQQLADESLRDLVEGGTAVHLLFLAPGGEAIGVREHEERIPAGQLSALTAMNIQILLDRVHARLSPEAQQRLIIATYDEVIRFNITLVDRRTAVVQPYLPSHRGVESPTLVLGRQDNRPGLFPLFADVFDQLAERSTPV